MRFLSLALCVMLLTACGKSAEDNTAPPPIPEAAPETVAAQPSKPNIYTVNYPLAWLAQQLGGEAVSVHFPAPGGEDPAFWKPEPGVIGRYQQADLVLLNGAGYARWMQQASMPTGRVLDTSQRFHEQIIYENAGPVHSHGPEGEHSHGEAAFTLWLDPVLFSLQGITIASALEKLLPDDLAALDKRLVEMRGRTGGWNTELHRTFKLLEGAPILFSHPVYQYLQQRHNLNGHALHWEPDQMPDDKQWTELEALLRKHPAKVMLWEDEPLPKVTERLSGLGIDVVVFRPTANRPMSGDYGTEMDANIERLKQVVFRLVETEAF